MNLFDEILIRKESISVIGLGYVGMPIAVAFAMKVNVIGYDNNDSKIELYKSGIDPTKEVGNEVIKNTTVEFTAYEKNYAKQNFILLQYPLQ